MFVHKCSLPCMQACICVCAFISRIQARRSFMSACDCTYSYISYLCTQDLHTWMHLHVIKVGQSTPIRCVWLYILHLHISCYYFSTSIANISMYIHIYIYIIYIRPTLYVRTHAECKSWTACMDKVCIKQVKTQARDAVLWCFLCTEFSCSCALLGHLDWGYSLLWNGLHLKFRRRSIQNATPMCSQCRAWALE